ncbi:hypothetical protein D3C87_1782810 [compost metagenome]
MAQTARWPIVKGCKARNAIELGATYPFVYCADVQSDAQTMASPPSSISPAKRCGDKGVVADERRRSRSPNAYAGDFRPNDPDKLVICDMRSGLAARDNGHVAHSGGAARADSLRHHGRYSLAEVASQ